MAGNARFNWIDPLLLDQQLTEEERMMRDSARAYAQEKLQPRVLKAFADLGVPVFSADEAVAELYAGEAVAPV